MGLQALVSLSFEPKAAPALKRGGALRIAYELLSAVSDKELRRRGATLVCNLSLDPHNKAQIVSTPSGVPLLERVLETLATPQRGEDAELALALGSLSMERALHPKLCTAGITAALFAALCHGQKEARGHAAWALSNLTHQQPLSMLCVDEHSPEQHGGLYRVHGKNVAAASAAA
eukprot:5234432-Prymnesium_polylepis.1